MMDVSSFAAIINPPESAILAVGATVERPVVVDGQIVVRSIMTVTLACDHRACSGADGARLLHSIKRQPASAVDAARLSRGHPGTVDLMQLTDVMSTADRLGEPGERHRRRRQQDGGGRDRRHRGHVR